jgi:hypothetical protein
MFFSYFWSIVWFRLTVTSPEKKSVPSVIMGIIGKKAKAF